MCVHETIELCDTHCHLDFEAFGSDCHEVIERARDAGLVWMLVPGIDVASSIAAVELTEVYPEVYAAVGVHPNNAGAWAHDTGKVLSELAMHPKVVAIGEIGLDYYRNQTPHVFQQKILREQLNLAMDKTLPVIIHNRNAEEDIDTLLTDWCAELVAVNNALVEHPGVLHSFCGSREFAQKIMKLKFFVGITGPVTFRNAQVQQDIVRWLPVDQMLVETDSPYLAPHPYRGRRNEPVYIKYIVEKIAELHCISLESVAKITTNNAKQLFGWRKAA